MTGPVLLIGASSPLGRAVRVELQSHGIQVTSTSRSGGGASEQLDVRDAIRGRAVLARTAPESVMYFARPDFSPSDDHSQAIDSAVDAARVFAQLSSEHRVRRFVFASSAAVYGTAIRTPRREIDPTPALSHYARLKLLSERAILDVAESSSLVVVSLRIFNLYGPGFSNSLVNRLITPDGPPPSVIRTENFVRDYVHVRDVARAFAMAADNAVTESTVLNVGTGVGTSNEELIRLCPEARYIDSTDTDGASFSIADTSLIRSLWNFDTQIAVQTALGNPEEFLR